MRALAVILVALVGCATEDDGGTAVSAMTSYACVTAAAGQGFISIPIDNATVLQNTTFSIQSSGTVDAVVGLSAGPATKFTNLATAFRLNPSGDVDVRDGSGYRADSTYAYGRNETARMVADLTTHTYSVALAANLGFEIAHQYHFRTERQAVTHLDHLSVIVDSASGSVTVCPSAGVSQGVAYSREGAWMVAPLGGGKAVMSDGATTMSLDASNHVLASLTRGGRVAADSSGNVFLATLSGTTLSLEKLNASLVSQWTKTRTLPSGHALLSVIADGSGGAALTTRNAGVGSVYAFRFASNGTYLGSHGATGEAIAVSPTAAFVAHTTHSTLTVKKLSTSWSTLWRNTYTGDATIDLMTAAPDGGVVFGGTLFTPTDFGGGPLPVPQVSQEQTPNNAYLVRLSASGTHVFSERTETKYIQGLVTNGHWIVVSTTYWTQLQYPRLMFFSMTGAGASDAPAFQMPGFTDDNDHGTSGEVALSADGHVWWNDASRWPALGYFPYLFAL